MSLLVVDSTSRLMTHPVFDNCRRSFFVGFSVLWAPPKPMTTIFVIRDPIVESNFCSPVGPSVLQDTMDISTFTSPRIQNTIGYKTDSAEKKGFAAPLREADEFERLEARVKEKEVELSRLRKSLNLLRNHYVQILKHNVVLTCDIRQDTTHLRELQ